MKAVIICNGDINDYSFFDDICRDDCLIICCDGGIRHTFKADIIPNYIIGDFDSAPKDIADYYIDKGVVIERFPTKKDSTDTELAVNFALELGADKIDIFGAIGTRIDHTLANIHSLTNALEKGIKARMINEHNIIQIINSRIDLTGKTGDLLSLIPLSDNVLGVTTFGLEYPLNDALLKTGIGASLGVSNRFINQNASVVIKKGLLIVIQSKDWF